MLLTAYFEFGVSNSTIIIGPKRTVKSGVKVTGKERNAVDKAAVLTSTNVAWVRVPVHDDDLCWLSLLLLLFSKSFFPVMVSLLGKNQHVQSPNRPLKCLQVVGDA